VVVLSDAKYSMLKIQDKQEIMAHIDDPRPPKKPKLKERLMRPDSKIEISTSSLLAVFGLIGAIAATSFVGWICFHTYMAYKLYLGL